MARLQLDGYGQIEINNCAFRRDGRIEAQCAPDTTDFATAKLENGMLLAVDAANRTIKFAVDSSLPIALNYSAEHMYDERKPGLKNFYLNGTDDFFPRLGYLAIGDKFTTNCVSYDAASESEFIEALASYKTTKLYGGASSDGTIAVSSSKPSYGPVLEVIEKTTMPDGTLGIKFRCIAE
jgi:hypothetical protein